MLSDKIKELATAFGDRDNYRKDPYLASMFANLLNSWEIEARNLEMRVQGLHGPHAPILPDRLISGQHVIAHLRFAREDVQSDVS